MTFAVLDVETLGLNAQAFQLGCLWLETWKNPEFYTNEKELWERIKFIGVAEKKNRRKLYVYAHNSAYDFYSLGEMHTAGVQYLCLKPFIAKYKEIVTFLDSKGIFTMPLSQLGELTGLKKIKINEKYYHTKYDDLEFYEKAQIREYCKRDVEVVLRAIKWLKNRLKLAGIPFKTIWTINQVGINWIMHHLKKMNVEELLNFYDGYKPKAWKTKNIEHIQEASRGGRNQAFQTGEYKHIDYIDLNSHYWKSTCEIPIPDLRTETTHTIHHKELWEQEILPKIGVSTVLMKNINDDIGLFPIQTSEGVMYPTKGQYFYGTYTHLEIQKGIEQHYEVIHVTKSTYYMKSMNYNPLKKIYMELWKNRQEADTDAEKWLFKAIGNSATGKFNQRRKKKTTLVIPIEDIEKEEYKDFSIKSVHNMSYIVEKEEEEIDQKPYYMPIIYCYITAQGRITLWEEMKKISKEDLIYCDTDSIIMNTGYLKKFNIGNDLGQFKIEVENGYHKNYGNKTYRVNDTIHIGGASTTKKNAYLQIEDFESGNIKKQKMHSIKTNPELAGTFYYEEENIKEREHNNKARQEKYKEEIFLYDKRTHINDKVLDKVLQLISCRTKESKV